MNDEVVEEFMEFVKATTVGRACYRSHDLPGVRVTPGCEEKEYMEAARHKRAILPDKRLWGHFELVSQYPFTKHTDIAHLEPNDVTCITPGYNRFEQSLPKTHYQTILANELLCSIRHGPLLGGKITAEDARSTYVEDRTKWDDYVNITAKAKNSTDKTQTRETFSAPADLREIMSELDHAAIPLCAEIPVWWKLDGPWVGPLVDVLIGLCRYPPGSTLGWHGDHKIGFVFTLLEVTTVAVQVSTLPYRTTPYRYYRYSNGQRFCVYWFIRGGSRLTVREA